MTNKPELRLGKTLVPGLLAVALFGLMAAIVLNTSFGSMADGGFEVESITAAIGYAMFDLGPLQEEAGVTGTEPFLAAFLLIAITLDAALDASLVLAKREEEGEQVTALASQGAGPAPGSDSQAGGQRAASDGGRVRDDATDANDGGESR
ncbi:hypothetical protein ACLI4Z_08650 [Natrialbaceae archaeon A-arb3/5]